MARVFTVPNYKGATENRYGYAVDIDAEDIEAYAAHASMWESDTMRALFADETEASTAVIARLEKAMSADAGNERAIRATAGVARVIAEIAEDRELVWDSDAAFLVLADMYGGKCAISSARDGEIKVARDLGDAIFAVGYAGALGSPGAVRLIQQERDYSTVEVVRNQRAVDWISFADDLRLGASFKGVAETTLDAFEDQITADGCKHHATGLARHARNADWYAVGHLLLYVTATECAVLNRISRNNLAACVYSAAMWAIGGAVDERPGALAAAKAGIDYVATSFRALTRDKYERIARSMKSSYAVLLCGMQDGLPEEFAMRQREALVAEVAALGLPTAYWHTVCSRWDRSLAVDYGTAWNLLPAPDIDARALFDSLKEKMGTEKTYDEAAWNEFIAYAGATITARYIAANPECEITWASGATVDPAWATECRKGTPVFPTKSQRDHMVRALSWRQHIETWHHTAQDVTHVYADRSMYGPGAPRMRNEDANELLYCLRHGSMFSGKYPAASVRAGFERGQIPGERVLYCSGKSENTKYGAKVRETMSADDVLRECLTEIDINLASVSSYVGGVAMRAGRAGTEALIKTVVDEARSGGILMSMDVSGWSPNMPVKGEMAFIDMLMSMFDIPDKMRASAIFKDLRVYVNKYPVNDSFDMKSGSVQGFFGTGDTIIHSMLAQFVLNKAKEDHPELAHATVAKVTLIDDILLAIRNADMPAVDVLHLYTAGYARLSFTVDLIKTLVGSITGVFLNRVYTAHGEITTSAKIFARADREWDRPTVGIIDEVASVFAGFAGCVDRGYSAVRAYRVACFRAAMRIVAGLHPYTLGARGVVALVAFLPATLGGLGIPTTTEWISETGGAGLCASIAAICSVRAHANTSDAAAYGVAVSVLNEALASTKRADRATHILSSVCSVARADFADPSSHLMKAIKHAVTRGRYTSDISKLIMHEVSDEDEAAWESAVSACNYDALLIADVMACLPAALSQALIARFTRSDACGILVKPATYAKARKGVIVTSRTHLKRMARLVADNDGEGGYATGTATSLVARLVQPRALRMGLVNAVIPSPVDAVGHVLSASDIAVYMNDPVSRAAPLKGCSISRTFSTSAVMGVETLNDRDCGPLAGCARGLVKALSFLAADGTDIGLVRKLCAATWGVHVADIKLLAVPDVNPRRLSTITKHRNHSVRAYPNSAGAVTVNLSRAFTRVSAMRSNVDLMSIRCVLTAAALLDIDCGCPVPIVRHYRVRTENGVIQQRQMAGPDAPSVTVSCAVQGAVADAFRAALISAVDGVEHLVVYDVEEGRITVLRPNVNTARTAAALVSAKSLFDAIVNSGRSSITVTVDDGDDASSRVVRRIGVPGAVDELTRMLRRYTTMSDNVYRANLAIMHKEITRVADATQIASVQAYAIRIAALDLDESRVHTNALYTACAAAGGASSNADYLCAMRTSMAEGYIEEVNAILSNPHASAADQGRAMKKRFMAAMCLATGKPGFTYGAAALSQLPVATANVCVTLAARTMSIDNDRIGRALTATAATADAAERCASIVRTLLGAAWRDLDIAMAGARGAARSMAQYISVDDTRPQVAAASSSTAALASAAVTTVDDRIFEDAMRTHVALTTATFGAVDDDEFGLHEFNGTWVAAGEDETNADD